LLSILADELGADSPEYKLAAALVTADNPATELDKVFNDFLKEGDADAIAEAGSTELGASPAPGV
jgi:hypothetical protein